MARSLRIHDEVRKIDKVHNSVIKGENITFIIVFNVKSLDLAAIFLYK